ncbi:MAG: DUF1178 family protein [Pseudomonadota bacterium]
MIQYALKCSNGHSFDSWFQSAEAYDKLANAGLVACAICGGTDVEKAVMAPRVHSAEHAEVGGAQKTPLSTDRSVAEQAVRELRKHIEENSDYVGNEFASEARAMHLGDTPERAIHGEANPAEARALIEDGVPMTPLPFMTGRKTN